MKILKIIILLVLFFISNFCKSEEEKEGIYNAILITPSSSTPITYST